MYPRRRRRMSAITLVADDDHQNIGLLNIYSDTPHPKCSCLANANGRAAVRCARHAVAREALRRRDFLVFSTSQIWRWRNPAFRALMQAVDETDLDFPENSTPVK